MHAMTVIFMLQGLDIVL